MSKSRAFSIFLLKQQYDADNSLKRNHGLSEKVIGAEIPENASLYILDSSPVNPWWKSYWGIQQDLKQVLKGAVVFLPIEDRCFALTFGHTYHKLKEDCYEYDFGLRTTLNAIDPDKIKSTDILQPENAKRERIQSPTASDLTFFDFNKDESIVKRLTGIVKAEYKEMFKNVTGASSLKVSTKVTADEITDLCEKLLEIYKKEDFKSNFPDIQNIIPVKDPTIIANLNTKLEEAFKAEGLELVLTTPDIINYTDTVWFTYSGAGKCNDIYEDVYIAHYRKYLKAKNIDTVDIKTLKSHKLKVCDENGNEKDTFSIYKTFLYDCEYNSMQYHLCEGEWYNIDKNYTKKLLSSLDPFFCSYDVLHDCIYKDEDEYNKSVAKKISKIICLDKKNIAPNKQTQVEPCDLYYAKEGIAQLIHIKISTRSSSLSHLFNQGLNSLELLRLEESSKVKLKKLINDESLTSPIDENKYAVIYGIITAKDIALKSKNLPIFSRISLLRTINTLKLMGVNVSVVLIKDLYDRKKVK